MHPVPDDGYHIIAQTRNKGSIAILKESSSELTEEGKTDTGVVETRGNRTSISKKEKKQKGVAKKPKAVTSIGLFSESSTEFIKCPFRSD
jgi:hypothetical protein